jgi:uncharacterized protein (TIGR02300 family)
MPKEEWGVKRVCPTTGKRFYDLNRSPVVSPYTGEVVDIDTARRKVAGAIPARPKPEKEDEAVVEDIEADDDLLTTDDSEDVDDDLLEDDDDDTVSLDDLADVSDEDEDL